MQTKHLLSRQWLYHANVLLTFTNLSTWQSQILQPIMSTNLSTNQLNYNPPRSKRWDDVTKIYKYLGQPNKHVKWKFLL
jgi:hypothetical protein